jgi:DNA-binding transcriptional LysR family regulator
LGPDHKQHPADWPFGGCDLPPHVRTVGGMELRHLRYFVTIAEEGSFTGAAERLWVAQPGLSAQIRRLEAEVALTLFERHSRGVKLTDAGELFLKRARIALGAAEDVRTTGHDLEAGLAGSLHLGLSTCGRCSRTPHTLQAFVSERPGVEVTICEAYAGTLVREVQGGRLDAAIVPGAFVAPELGTTSLGSDPLILAVASGHRLAGSDPIEISALEDEEVIITNHPDGAAYDRSVAGILDERGVSYVPRPGGVGPQLLEPVNAGQAVAITTAASIEQPGVLLRELRPEREMPFGVVYRDGPAPAALSAFIDVAKAASRMLVPGARRAALAAA